MEIYMVLLNHLKARRKKKITITIGELRQLLLTKPQTYPHYGSFKQHILAPLLKAINETTDRNIVMIELKRGTQVKELEFTIKKKTRVVVPQTRTVVLRQLSIALDVIASGELHACMSSIKHYVENIYNIIEQMSFIEECHETAELYADEYERESQYKYDMEATADGFQNAVDARDGVIDAFANVHGVIETMLEEIPNLITLINTEVTKLNERTS